MKKRLRIDPSDALARITTRERDDWAAGWSAPRGRRVAIAPHPDLPPRDIDFGFELASETMADAVRP